MPGPGVGPNGPSRTLAEGGQRVRSTRGRRGASDQNGWVPVEPRDTGRTGLAEKVGMGGRGPGAYLGVAEAGVSPSPGASLADRTSQARARPRVRHLATCRAAGGYGGAESHSGHGRHTRAQRGAGVQGLKWLLCGSRAPILSSPNPARVHSRLTGKSPALTGSPKSPGIQGQNHKALCILRERYRRRKPENGFDVNALGSALRLGVRSLSGPSVRAPRHDARSGVGGWGQPLWLPRARDSKNERIK